MPVLSLHYRVPAEGAFNIDYYCDDHLALVERVWGRFLTRVDVLKGESGLPPRQPAEFALIALLHFASEADLASALAHPDAALLHKDIAHFSSVAPTAQINSVLHTRASLNAVRAVCQEGRS